MKFQLQGTVNRLLFMVFKFRDSYQVLISGILYLLEIRFYMVLCVKCV